MSANLEQARAARAAGEYEKAKLYYKEVYDAAPDNLEAEWFYNFFSAMLGVTSVIADHYVRLTEIFYPTLEYVATIKNEDTKLLIARDVVKGFLPMRTELSNAIVMARAHGNTAIELDDAVKINMAKMYNKEDVAEKILEIFENEGPCCMLAVDIWKEQIAERFKWSEYRNFQDKGKELWFDALAKRIKKYDPTYEMPQFKQAGCISSGDAAKVTPGK